MLYFPYSLFIDACVELHLNNWSECTKLYFPNSLFIDACVELHLDNWSECTILYFPNSLFIDACLELYCTSTIGAHMHAALNEIMNVSDSRACSFSIYTLFIYVLLL